MKGAAHILLWPLLMSASIVTGLIMAFIGSGAWDAIGLALTCWTLWPVGRAWFGKRSGQQAF